MSQISICTKCTNICDVNCNWCRNEDPLKIFKIEFRAKVRCCCYGCLHAWKSENVLWGDLHCPSCKQETVGIRDPKKRQHEKLWELVEKIVENRNLKPLKDYELDRDHLDFLFTRLKDKFVLCYFEM